MHQFAGQNTALGDKTARFLPGLERFRVKVQVRWVFPEASLCSSQKATLILTLFVAAPLASYNGKVTFVTPTSLSYKRISLIVLGPIHGGEGGWTSMTYSKSLDN